jgi:hypothetical protein
LTILGNSPPPRREPKLFAGRNPGTVKTSDVINNPVHRTPDVLARLAMALADGKGRYALLLGSGVSRGTGMPTGWDVVRELLSRYARATRSEIPADPIAFWRENLGADPGYSSILEELAATPAERQALLEPFWIPTGDELEQGSKIPGAAHKAIAALVKDGVFRVILTTNFDTLLEQALDAAGVIYRVVANGDDADGAPPYAHGGVFIIKVSGDYRDTRILNTLAELSTIDDRLGAYVSRVLDDFGLLVCGWSAEWDLALADLIRAASNRRYTTWWTHRGEITAAASLLIDRRDAQEITISDVDSFFADLQIRVEAIMEMREPRLDDPAQAAAVVKLLLKSPANDIKLRESILREAEFVRDKVLEIDLQRAVDTRTLAQHCEEIVTVTSALRAMLATLAFYGDAARHGGIVHEAILRLVLRTPLAGNMALIKLIEHGPPSLAADAAALGAYLADHPDFFRAVYGGSVEINGKTTSLAFLTALSGITDDVANHLLGSQFFCPITYYERKKARDLVPILMLDGQAFDDRYLDFDYFRSIIVRHLTGDGVPLYGEGTRQSRPRARVDQDRASRGEAWPAIASGLISNKDWLELTTNGLESYKSTYGYQKDGQIFP